MKYCKYCGAQLDDDAVVCSACGKSLEEQANQTIIIQQAPVEKSQNKCGVAGFVLSLIFSIGGLVGMLVFSPLMFVQFLPFLLSLIGLIVGKKKDQKISLSVTGLIISGIQVVLAFVFVFGLGAMLR